MCVKDPFILHHPKSHAYAQNSKHMRGKLRSSFKHHDPRTHVEDQVYAWKTRQRAHVIRELPPRIAWAIFTQTTSQDRGPTLCVAAHVMRGSSRYAWQPTYMRGSSRIFVETSCRISRFSNSNSNPISFGHQFNSLIK
ncbi:hypothetical protein PIB30_113689, partial [Stylosanthes scabra]|nr:hypothetical protein [Stylosanthes scabra]